MRFLPLNIEIFTMMEQKHHGALLMLNVLLRLKAYVIPGLIKMKFKVWDKEKKKLNPDSLPQSILERLPTLQYDDSPEFALLQDGGLIVIDKCGNYAYLDSERFEVII